MPERKYGSKINYARKLERVMERFGVEWYNFGSDRFGCFVEFRLKGQLYRFDHTLDTAKAQGITKGSDVFAQVVLALEDLARLAERGIYEISTWVAGMKCLPATAGVPSFFKYLRFTEIPDNAEDVKARYREMALQMHPDQGGDPEDFRRLTEASEKAVQWFGGRSQ